MKRDDNYHSNLKKHYEGLIVSGNMPQTLKNLERDADSYANKDDQRALSEYFSLGILYGLTEDGKAVQRVGKKGRKAADRLGEKSGKTGDQVLEELAELAATELSKRLSPGKRLAEIVGIIGILGALVFLSPNLTGNVISNLANSTSNILGAVLLVVGLVAGYFWVKR